MDIAPRWLSIISSNKREWNNCFIKNNQELLLDRADFALQEQAEDNLMVAFSWAWYNGSYTMAAKPIKSLELHYTMIQFLITSNIWTVNVYFSSQKYDWVSGKTIYDFHFIYSYWMLWKQPRSGKKIQAFIVFVTLLLIIRRSLFPSPATFLLLCGLSCYNCIIHLLRTRARPARRQNAP